MWYDDQPDYSCYDCEDKQFIIDEVKHFFDEIVKQLYGINEFDLKNFEFCLDNLCAQLKVQIPDGNLILQKITPTDKALDAWKKWNTNYLKKLTYQI